MRHNLTIEGDLIVYGYCLLISARMHRSALNQLHESHQRMACTKAMCEAYYRIYWPGLDNDIDNVVLQCKQCQTHLPSHPKKPLETNLRLFQEIAADFCHHPGQCYLVILDCFTDWPIVIPLGTSATSTDLISATRELFSRTAVPNVRILVRCGASVHLQTVPAIF